MNRYALLLLFTLLTLSISIGGCSKGPTNDTGDDPTQGEDIEQTELNDQLDDDSLPSDSEEDDASEGDSNALKSYIKEPINRAKDIGNKSASRYGELDNRVPNN